MTILILVESPNKARAVAQYARGVFNDKKVLVRSTLGHLRDLPEDKLGVNLTQGFRPEFVIRNPKAVSYLRPYVRDAESIYLAMDPDREGEAIAWHVTKVFATELSGKQVHRVSFNAITREVVQKGLKHPRPINENIVKAAVARRVVDRLIGYKISPRLWANVEGKGLSAGRVQTLALMVLASQARDEWEIEISF